MILLFQTGFPHTDAVFQNEAQSFVWGHSGEGLNPLLRVLKITMPPNHNYGLFVMFGQSKLMSESTNMPQSYVCYNQTNADLVLEQKQKHHSNPFPSEKVKKESENRYKKTQRAGQNVTFIGSYEGTSYFFDPSMVTESLHKNNFQVMFHKAEYAFTRLQLSITLPSISVMIWEWSFRLSSQTRKWNGSLTSLTV